MALVLDRNSKADTRFFCDRGGGGAPELATDLGQYRADLTDNTTYLTSTDTRLAVRSPREISVVIDIATGNSRVVLNWGNAVGTTYIYRITVAGGGNIQFGHNNALLATVTAPNIAAGARSYVLHWSTDYDVREATYFSEIAVCDVTSGDWAITRVTHSQPQAPAGGDQFNLCGYGAGTLCFTGGLTAYDFVRVGCRFHSTTEAQEDWVAESSAPSVIGEQLEVELAPSSTSFFTEDPSEAVSDAVLDAGTFAGPAELAAVINAAAGRQRLRSPLVNLAPTTPPTLDNTYAPAAFFTEMGLSNYKVHAGHVFVRPSSLLQGFRARVRVHAQTWISAGAPGGTVVDVTLSAHTFSTFAVMGTAITIALAISDNHTSTGVGEWYELGDLVLGGQYLAVGFKFGTGTGASYLRMKIKGIAFEPYEE